MLSPVVGTKDGKSSYGWMLTGLSSGHNSAKQERHCRFQERSDLGQFTFTNEIFLTALKSPNVVMNST